MAIAHSISLGGVTAHIYAGSNSAEPSKTAVLFVLHGHPASARHMKPIVDGVFEVIEEKAENILGDLKRSLVVVTLDPEAECDELDEPESGRLYRQQERMARGVSALVTMLPSVLSPNHDNVIDTWMVAGLSLGAHAAWMAIDRGKSFRVCIPIIGSPDFLDIATVRNGTPGVPLVSSYIPITTRNHIIKHDPVSRRRNSSCESPFMNKHILALAGAQDGMVPLHPTRAFLDRIDVGPKGTKRLVIQRGVGHQCTREMVKEMTELVWKVALV